ncbi:hypothetical protein BLNAU_12004 [Blattamonas nauphoetae]|uniref:Uncharacterized protein n=1 Tax=Blattamonas nauphoetae TaxID=2049346 RepID=A0ABQ9XND7_9EUKA|nr:hypothetical protein BLNAU_12004 [Blattamonas nauphoetae]
MDCSAFLNWSIETPGSEDEKAVIFRSLVATVKSQPTLDDSLQVKAVKLLKSLDPDDEESAEAFLRRLGQTTDESLTNFVQSIVVLLSSASRVITTAAVKILQNLFFWFSPKDKRTLVKADLIPQLINTLNPHTLSSFFYLTTPDGFASLRIEDDNEQQAVHETVLQQVLIPSEKYICPLCVNRFSILDSEQSQYFLGFLTRLLEICPSYQPTMDFILHMPVTLTIPSYLTFLENDRSIGSFLFEMSGNQREWNKTMGEKQQPWKIVLRMLRMEGIEDVIEEKLRNNRNEVGGRLIFAYSMIWNNLLSMNVPEEE